MLLFNKLKSKSLIISTPLKYLGRPFGFVFINLIAIFVTSLSFVFLKLHHFNYPKIPSFLFLKQTLVSSLKKTLHLSLKTFYLLSHPNKKSKKINFPRLNFPRITFSPKLTFFRQLNIYFCLVFIISLSLSIAFYYHIIYKLPQPENLIHLPQKITTQIFDRNGELLFKIYQDENRTPVKIQDLPLYLPQAFIAIEDKDFYSHHGFSLKAIARAIRQNITNPNRIEGGSTITQQLIKNTLLTTEKTWERKIKEVILAIKTESLYNKDTILEMYLNQVGFGGPAYGIEAASQQYFGISAKNLNLAQASFLAGLPKAPSKFSPYLNPETAIARGQLVLDKMLEQNYLTSEQHQEALHTKLEFVTPKIEIKAPHFVMFVRDLLITQYGEDLVENGGLKVTTSLDLSLQNLAQEAVSQELNKLKNLNVKNGAALITKPKTGEILAMVGSKNYFDFDSDGQVNLTTALRQPGSSVKPINYALALEKGTSINYRLNDSPIAVRINNSETWIPKNYDGHFHGQVTLRQALANSYNIPAVILLSQNGIKNMANLAKQLGITTWNDDSRLGLSLTLGGIEVKMTDMAEVFGTFANSGIHVKLNPILKIEDKDGQSVPFSPCFANEPQTPLTVEAQESNCLPQQVLKPETAYLISDILSDNNARAAAFGYNSILNIKNHQIAVKTGTSNDLRDNWTIGYNPNYVVATWVGNNDNSPMNQVASGITGASPIWNKIFTTLTRDDHSYNPFVPPENLIRVSICSLTGTLSCSGCPSYQEYFVKGQEPKTACNPDTIKQILEEKNKQTINTSTN